MNNSDFAHWHVHTEFSSFDGLSPVEALIYKAREMGFPAIAITDHGVVSSWIKVLRLSAAKKDKRDNVIAHDPIKPILGAELYLSANHRYRSKEDQINGKSGNRHINLFASNYEGYKNISKLCQLGWTDGFYHSPRIDVNQLIEHSKGVVLGSACLSSVVNANLLYGRYDKAIEAASMFKDIFQDRMFLEVMYHGISEEAKIIPDIFKISKELKIPVLATNDCHFINKDDGQSQEVLMAMSTSKCLKDPKRLHFPYYEFYVKSAEEMMHLWRDTPYVIHNTVAMTEMIDTEDIKKNLFGVIRLPEFDVTEKYNSPYECVEALAWEGLKKEGWDQSPKHVEKLKSELSDVRIALEHNNLDFPTYFLIIADAIKEAESKGIMVANGRGSGYASLLLRCMGITYGPDPLEYNLIFERFLGFSDMRFVEPRDFGLRPKKKEMIELLSSDEDSDEIEEH